jgi:VanZ family protein
MRFHYLLVCLVYCAGIFWISSQPRPLGIQLSIPGLDKVAHFLAYGGLAGLISVGMRRSGRSYRPAVLFWLPIVLTAFYGVSDEFHQYFVPQRSCSVGDALADVSGAMAAQAVLYLVVYRLPMLRRHLMNPTGGNPNGR